MESSSGKWQAVLVDDDALSRASLRSLLACHESVEIVGEAESTEEAVELAFRHRPTLVFLDIRMPGESGFDLLPHLPASARVVFVTASESYAVDAIEHQADGYLIKPVSPIRLGATLRRLSGNPSRSDRGGPERTVGIPLRADHELVVIPPLEIGCIEADGNYTRIYRAGHPPLLVRRTLREWADALPEGFVRVNRQILVRLQAIVRLRVDSRDRGMLTLQGRDQSLLLGRRSLRNLKKLLFGASGIKFNGWEKKAYPFRLNG